MDGEHQLLHWWVCAAGVITAPVEMFSSTMKLIYTHLYIRLHLEVMVLLRVFLKQPSSLPWRIRSLPQAVVVVLEVMLLSDTSRGDRQSCGPEPQFPSSWDGAATIPLSQLPRSVFHGKVSAQRAVGNLYSETAQTGLKSGSLSLQGRTFLAVPWLGARFCP